MGTMLRPRNLLRPAERYPADPRAVFILALSVFSGLGALVAEEAPESLAAALPEWGIFIWSLGLGLGSFFALAGLTRDSVNGIIVEQVGSVMVAAATIFYSVIALWIIGGGAGQPIMIILGWGVACAIRWGQLQLLLRRIHAETIAVQTVEIVDGLIESHAPGKALEQ